MESSTALLAQLSKAAGTPGNEGDVRAVIRQHLEGLADFSHDKLGSLICRRKGEPAAPKVMLAGHMDELGFIVRLVTEDGFIKFHNLGGWWTHTMLAQRVVIKAATGDVPGVIGAKPTHHLGAEERKKLKGIPDMYIDVGASSKQEAMEEFGIQPGDHIVPSTEFVELRNRRLVSGKAFDDRVGVALFVDAIRRLADEGLPNAVYGVGTAQEEVGTRGAKTAAQMIDPDVAIVLEGCPADDTPGFVKEERQGVLGQGPQIRLFDPSMIPNRALSRFVLDVAQGSQITHQVAVRVSSATDGRPIHVHHTGVPTVVIAPPVRYIHSHVGVLHLDDYDNALHLLMELLRRLDAETVASFTAF
ncbi:M20/M25/M40 family metallo-hydrolase [candidate division KSB3 bacterium]|uniref:M20/M25/M40 family metallo-hydrolase n=1 Tax=candidate division KSB3 bacterium TaxID=2044937 RepID=A0A9D5JT37_9BACT|nr:M20/M25/M40 family metallo-hydrolase [candidate division KSB3 bacterium]MBD3323511.1 M20/M25/M40 family metallo-hydrolase [candidate division KSB3 bacterium]